MSRPSKFLVLTIVVIFLLACGSVSQPLQNPENQTATAQSRGVETFKAYATSMPEVDNVFAPEGAPVQEWKGIPVMPQATAGQEFAAKNTYSFQANVTIQEVQDFYSEKLTALGWGQPYEIPSEEDAGLMVFQKESSTLTITITAWDDYSVITLTLK